MVDKRKQGKTNRRKGWRVENEAVHAFNDNLVPAKRTAHPGIPGDITIQLDKPRKVEVKYRKIISNNLWEWLENVDFTLLRKARKDFIIQMKLKTFFELLGVKNDSKKKQHKSVKK